MKKTVLLVFIIALNSCSSKKMAIGMYSSFLSNEMNELKTYITEESIINESISTVKVGWHLEHILLTINEIYLNMESSNPKTFKKRPNLTRILMFSGNKIPRGKAKAPQVVQPQGKITVHRILKNYELAEEVLQKFDALNEYSYIKHPSAGYLNREDAKRFLKIHTEHHLKIIRDILNIETTNSIDK
ncbi:hypothetical protein ACU8DI_13050 [Psychroserpens sp. BH13MA-6]